MRSTVLTPKGATRTRQRPSILSAGHRPA
jgi:hypothetical protein